MPLFDLCFFLGRKLTKNLAQRFPQLLKQQLAPIFRDENNVIFAVPRRVV
jgi:hypothetical protein